MTWFSDLAPCTYFGEEFAESLVAVGWLQQGQSFPKGHVENDVYKQLCELIKDAWQPGIVIMGYHNCDLCYYEGKTGKRNLFIPAGNAIYVCPELITHYMNAHGYKPPETFCQKVMECPPMRSMPYLKALLEGAKSFVQFSTGQSK